MQYATFKRVEQLNFIVTFHLKPIIGTENNISDNDVVIYKHIP